MLHKCYVLGSCITAKELSQLSRFSPARRRTAALRPLLFYTFCDITLVDEVQQGMVVWGEGGWPCILAFEWKKKALSPQTGGVESERTHSQPLEYSPRTAVPCFPTQPVQIAVVLPRHCADLCMRMTSALRHYVEAALLFTNPLTTGFGWTSWNFAKQIEGRRKCFNYENYYYFIFFAM